MKQLPCTLLDLHTQVRCRTNRAKCCQNLFCESHCKLMCVDTCPRHRGSSQCVTVGCHREYYVCLEKSCATCCTDESCNEPGHRLFLNAGKNKKLQSSTAKCSCGKDFSKGCDHKSCSACCTDIACTRHKPLLTIMGPSTAKSMSTIKTTVCSCGRAFSTGCIHESCAICCTDLACTRHKPFLPTKDPLGLDDSDPNTEFLIERQGRENVIHRNTSSPWTVGKTSLCLCGEAKSACKCQVGPIKKFKRCVRGSCNNTAPLTCSTTSCKKCCRDENCPKHRRPANISCKRKQKSVSNSNAGTKKKKQTVEDVLQVSPGSSVSVSESSLTNTLSPNGENVNEAAGLGPENDNDHTIEPRVEPNAVEGHEKLSCIKLKIKLSTLETVETESCLDTDNTDKVPRGSFSDNTCRPSSKAMGTNCPCGRQYSTQCVGKLCSRCCTDISCLRHREGHQCPAEDIEGCIRKLCHICCQDKSCPRHKGRKRCVKPDCGRKAAWNCSMKSCRTCCTDDLCYHPKSRKGSLALRITGESTESAGQMHLPNGTEPKTGLQNDGDLPLVNHDCIIESRVEAYVDKGPEKTSHFSTLETVEPELYLDTGSIDQAPRDISDQASSNSSLSVAETTTTTTTTSLFSSIMEKMNQYRGAIEHLSSVANEMISKSTPSCTTHSSPVDNTIQCSSAVNNKSNSSADVQRLCEPAPTNSSTSCICGNDTIAEASKQLCSNPCTRKSCLENQLHLPSIELNSPLQESSEKSHVPSTDGGTSHSDNHQVVCKRGKQTNDDINLISKDDLHLLGKKQKQQSVLLENRQKADGHNPLPSQSTGSSLANVIDSVEEYVEDSERKLYLRYSNGINFNDKTATETIQKFCPVEQVVRIDDQSACVVLDDSATFGMYDTIYRELRKQSYIYVEPYAQYLMREKKAS